MNYWNVGRADFNGGLRENGWEWDKNAWNQYRGELNFLQKRSRRNFCVGESLVLGASWRNYEAGKHLWLSRPNYRKWRNLVGNFFLENLISYKIALMHFYAISHRLDTMSATKLDTNFETTCTSYFWWYSVEDERILKDQHDAYRLTAIIVPSKETLSSTLEIFCIQGFAISLSNGNLLRFRIKGLA